MRLRLRIPGAVFLLTLLFSATSQAQAPRTTVKKTKGMDDPVVAKAVAYLRSQVVGTSDNSMEEGSGSGMGGGMEVGEAALAALAMHKADLPDNDPAIRACLKIIMRRFGPNGFVPMRKGGHENYEYAVVCMCLTAIDPGTYKPQIELLVRDIVRLQKSYGGWDYVADKGGDTSMTQYCLLALWEAESIGIDISPKVWDTCAQFFLKTQFSDGGWSYHHDEVGQWGETVAMTAAGVGCLLICNDMLSKFFQATRAFNPLLTPLIYEGTVLEKYARYKVATSETGLKRSVERGIVWIRQKYRPAKDAITGQSMYYSLYGMERTGALAGDLMGSRTWWYDPGTVAVKTSQGGNGSFDDDHGAVPNTSWAILFLVKSTAKTLRAIELRRLGAGTLIGGRNLPPDLTNLTIAQGRVVVKPMNGAVEGMLAVLEDPRALNAESALAGLVGRFQSEGPSALRPFKDRFRKLLEDRDPGIRRVACWGLGRSGDMDVAPDLIRALMDRSGDVVDEARVGLQVLSRKLDNLGPPRGASAEQKVAAARRWKDWYDAVRTPDLPPVEDARLNPPVPAAPPTSAASAEGQP